MKNLKFLHLLILNLVIILLTSHSVCAQGIASPVNPEKVTFIYIHGVDETDPKDFDNEVKGLHKYFANKKLGNYVISPCYNEVFWGNLPLEDAPFQLFKSGLLGANMDYNIWHVKKTIEPKFSLMFNPFYRYTLIGDKGANTSAVFMRNFINVYVYNLVWVRSDLDHPERSQAIFNLIQKQIDQANGKYVIVAHSLGSVLATRFLMERVLLDPSNSQFNKKDYDNFVGLITSGDVNNTFNAATWDKQITPKDYKCNKNNFIRYFVENGKFWIAFNHRNDMFGTKLSPIITAYSNCGSGFIVSKVNKAYPLESMISLIRFWDRSDGAYLAHQWMFNKPKAYANSVLKVYNQTISSKSQLSQQNTILNK